MKRILLLLLGCILAGCTPQDNPASPAAAPSSVTPVQTPVTSPVQVTMLAPGQTVSPDVVPLADAIRFCGAAVVLASLIVVFGRAVSRTITKARRGDR